MKYTDLAIRIPQHVIVAGDPKTGKSTLAAKLAEAGFKLLWFSLDGGHTIISKLSQKAKENIEIVVFPDTMNFPVAIKSMRDILRGGSHNICDSHGQINCALCKKSEASFSVIDLDKIINDPVNTWIVVIDQISQLADSAENYVRKAAKLSEDEKFEYAHFAHWMNIMKEVMSALQVAPYNVLALAHLVESEMEDGKKKLVPMVGSSVFSRKVGGYFDHVVYLEVGNMQHKAGSSSVYSGKALTGSRTDIKIEAMKEMSLVPFFDGTMKKEIVADTLVKLEEMKVPVSDIPVPTAAAVVVVEASVDPKVPGAGVTTSMHSPTPVAAGQSQSNAAAEALKKLRGG